MTTPVRTTPTPDSLQGEAPRATRPPIRWGRLAAWGVLLATLVITLFPFYWMLRTSLSSNHALAAGSDSVVPVDLTLSAYQRVFGLTTTAEALEQGGSGAEMNFWRYLGNSVLVCTIQTVGQVLSCALAAYAFARLRWPGRDALFFTFLTALMVPPIFTILPNFLLIRELGLLNTYMGIILPTLLMTPFAVFFLRQFFLGISREVEEAARVDGAGHLRMFFRIILPMSTTPVTTLAILVYIVSWNDYMWPLLVGREENVRVLTVALGTFQSQAPQGSTDWSGLMAATLIAALPVLLLFLVLGRRVINSIGFTGIR
jgi:multiple sugar transport system permease protein